VRRITTLLVLVAVAGLAWASRTRLRLERLDPTEFASDGRIKLFASIVELEGNVVDDKGAAQFTLRIDGKPAGKPEKMTRFSSAGEPLDLVVVVESSALYGPQKVTLPPPTPPPPKGGKGRPRDRKGQKDKGAKAPPGRKGLPPPPSRKPLTALAPGEEPLDRVKEAVKQLLESMSPKWRVLVIDYGGEVTAHPPFRPPQAAVGPIDDLLTDTESGDVRLSQAVDAALLELNKPRPDGLLARRLIVLVSDGLNWQMERKTFRTIGGAAAKARVPIHTIAFSPTDDRGPLLNLGEIAKLSNGTFRWARTAEDLKAQIETLSDELHKQYVLTFALDIRSLEGKTFVLTCDDLVSNPLVYDEAGGRFGMPVGAGKRRLPWWLWAGGGGLLALIAVVVLVIRARNRPVRRFATTRQPGGAPVAGPSRVAPQAQAQVRAQPAAPVVRRGTLIMVSGALAGRQIAVAGQPVLVGKGPASIQITDDPAVSTRHAQVALDRGNFVITDLGSTNGTWVNGIRISEPTRLGDGDLVRFGNTQVKFRIE